LTFGLKNEKIKLRKIHTFTPSLEENYRIPMSKIKILSQNLVNKIAAGEVVERPASVVKELLENSLDAKAKNIKIEIEQAGLKKISVLDDGEGMDELDLRQCFKPHATSKIFTEQELLQINSLGFRGEALPSIASVSKTTIKSRPKSINWGQIIKIQDDFADAMEIIGMNTGTEIIVEDLFTTIPVRRKFLKSPATEFRQIVQVIINTALTFPQVGFSLHHNGKETFNFSSNENRAERIKNIFGASIFSQLIPLRADSPYCEVIGYIGHPQIANPTKAKQFVFVNNRPIKNIPLALAVKDGYGTLVANRDYPVIMLFVSAPAETIDVNIHPRKEEIMLFKQKEITNSLREAVEKTLQENDLTYQVDNRFRKRFYNIDTKNGIINDNDNAFYNIAKTLRKSGPLWQVKAKEDQETAILQIDNTYLIAETNNGVLIIDQHAAHERILYEQLLKHWQKSTQESQKYILSKPIIFDLPITDANFLTENLSVFQRLGFDMELFGNMNFKINAVPKLFSELDLKELILAVLEDLKQEKKPSTLNEQVKQIINYLACRSAIKAGDYLNTKERQRLLEKMKETDTTYTCPHGRPTQIEISSRELEMIFRRR